MSRPPTDSKERLCDQALTLFASKGYAATSIRDIIEAVGVSKPVLYYYFQNKLALFSGLVGRVHATAYHDLNGLASQPGPAREKLQAILRRTFAFCAADWRVPRMMFAATFGVSCPEIDQMMKRFSDDRYQLIRNLVTSAVSGGEFREIDPDVTALAFCSLMDHPCNLFTLDPESASLLTPQLADTLFQSFLQGVALT